MKIDNDGFETRSPESSKIWAILRTVENNICHMLFVNLSWKQKFTHLCSTCCHNEGAPSQNHIDRVMEGGALEKSMNPDNRSADGTLENDFQLFGLQPRPSGAGQRLFCSCRLKVESKSLCHPTCEFLLSSVSAALHQSKCLHSRRW